MVSADERLRQLLYPVVAARRPNAPQPIAFPGMAPEPEPLFARWIVGDVLDGLAAVPSASVQAIVTSIPYWGRKRYTDDPREIGVGSLKDYLDALDAVFSLAREKLHPTGICWLNVGDTAVGSGGAGGDYLPGGSKHGQRKYRQGDAGGIPKGQWADVPHRLLHRLQALGWYLRMPIVWDKMACRPEDLGHARRPGEQFEHIFMLTRRPNGYRFYEDRLVERGNVWHFRPGGSGTGHIAPFPEELPERCILPSTDPLDVVLDIFAGSGTTLAVAARHGRSSIGIDFDPEQEDEARKRVEALGLPLGRARPARPPAAEQGRAG